MKIRLKKHNKLLVLVILLLLLSSFSITFADNKEDMPIERGITIEKPL